MSDYKNQTKTEVNEEILRTDGPLYRRQGDQISRITSIDPAEDESIDGRIIGIMESIPTDIARNLGINDNGEQVRTFNKEDPILEDLYLLTEKLSDTQSVPELSYIVVENASTYEDGAKNGLRTLTFIPLVTGKLSEVPEDYAKGMILFESLDANKGARNNLAFEPQEVYTDEDVLLEDDWDMSDYDPNDDGRESTDDRYDHRVVGSRDAEEIETRLMRIRAPSKKKPDRTLSREIKNINKRKRLQEEIGAAADDFNSSSQ